MEKKNRTGLQSKISHIFAGVPVPKKSKSASEQSEPEEKNSVPEIKQSVADDFVIEQNVSSEDNADLEVDITDISLEQEPLDQKQDLYQAEQNEMKSEPLEYFEKSSANQQPEDPSSLEQFTIISEPDSEEEIKYSPTKADESHKEEKTSASIPNDTENQAQQSSEKIEKKPQVKESIPEPLAGDTMLISGLKDAVRASRPLANSAPALTEKPKQITRIPKRKPPKRLKKQIKSKSEATQPKQKLMIALILILPVVLVLVLLKNNGFFESSSTETVIDEQPVTQVVSVMNSKSPKINWSQPPIYPADLRDPMELSKDVIEEEVIIENPDLEIRGTSYAEGGDYRVTISGIDVALKKDEIIKDGKSREVKIVDIQKNRITFEMTSVFWIYDLDLKKWIQVDEMDILGD